jgi:hypothetical protein
MVLVCCVKGCGKIYRYGKWIGKDDHRYEAMLHEIEDYKDKLNIIHVPCKDCIMEGK